MTSSSGYESISIASLEQYYQLYPDADLIEMQPEYAAPIYDQAGEFSRFVTGHCIQIIEADDDPTIGQVSLRYIPLP